MSRTRTVVLVVDDSPEFLDVARRILGAARVGFDVRTVETGADAVAYLAQRPPYDEAPRPSFVLLDFHLPDMKAPAVLDVWRASGALAELPVLVLSQADWAGDEASVLDAGATSFRVKPSRPQALREIVLEFWKEHPHASQRPSRR